MIICNWLRDAAEELAALGITTALLDAELILAHTIGKSRTYLHAHGDETIEPRRLEIANTRLSLRKDRVPIAYIIGHKEFYGRLFKVTPSVLIPRPESEAIIDSLKQFWGEKPGKLLDIGTGSGCLGITAKLELPLDVTLSDISRHALAVAQDNAKLLGADITLQQSNLLEDIAGSFDVILANLPYVSKAWKRSPETNHEPELALFAENDGLSIILRLLNQVNPYLKNNGLLLLEADSEQHPKIINHAKNHGLNLLGTLGYCLAFQKAS